MLPKYFEFCCPTKILCGHDALENLAHELRLLSSEKPMIITDEGVLKVGLAKQVESILAKESLPAVALFSDVPPDSSSKVVLEATKVYGQNNCDAIVAIGGGSVIDTAKGVNILATKGGDNLHEYLGAEVLKGPFKPLAVVPTTSGTGSEVTSAAVIVDADTGRKLLFTAYDLIPQIAVVDSRMTMTLPPKMTAATGMDAMTHAVEAYLCLQKNPISDVYATAAIKLLSENLVSVVSKGGNKEERLALGLGATLAGVAFSNSMVGMVHSLGHATGAIGHIPHGVAMNIFLPHALMYNMEKVRASLGELLLPLRGPDVFAKTEEKQRALAATEAICEIRQKLYEMTELPRNLKEAGIQNDQLESIAKVAIDDGSVVFNPVELEYMDALRVLQATYESTDVISTWSAQGN
jgi:alcohol dehydrogenase